MRLLPNRARVGVVRGSPAGSGRGALGGKPRSWRCTRMEWAISSPAGLIYHMRLKVRIETRIAACFRSPAGRILYEMLAESEDRTEN